MSEVLFGGLFVGLGGAVGAVLRYSAGFLPIPGRESFPLITLGVNLFGAFLIGLVVGWASKHTSVSPNMVLFLKTGVCGGFTTFSTFSLESVQLLQSGRYGAFALYAVLSLAMCIGAVAAGMSVMK